MNCFEIFGKSQLRNVEAPVKLLINALKSFWIYMDSSYVCTHYNFFTEIPLDFYLYSSVVSGIEDAIHLILFTLYYGNSMTDTTF